MEVIKKVPGNIDLKNKTTEKKTLLMGLIAEWRWQSI